MFVVLSFFFLLMSANLRIRCFFLPQAGFFTGAVALVGWSPGWLAAPGASTGDAGDASPENQPEGKTALAFKKNTVTRMRGFHWGLWSHRDESRKTQVTSWGKG